MSIIDRADCLLHFVIVLWKTSLILKKISLAFFNDGKLSILIELPFFEKSE